MVRSESSQNLIMLATSLKTSQGSKSTGNGDLSTGMASFR